MFLLKGLVLIFLTIANKKSSAFVNFDQTIPEDTTKHVSTYAGECILKCSNGNNNNRMDYGCFDECMYDSPYDFQLKKSIKKDDDVGAHESYVTKSETLEKFKNVLKNLVKKDAGRASETVYNSKILEKFKDITVKKICEIRSNITNDTLKVYNVCQDVVKELNETDWTLGEICCIFTSWKCGNPGLQNNAGIKCMETEVRIFFAQTPVRKEKIQNVRKKQNFLCDDDFFR